MLLCIIHLSNQLDFSKVVERVKLLSAHKFNPLPQAKAVVCSSLVERFVFWIPKHYSHTRPLFYVSRLINAGASRRLVDID